MTDLNLTATEVRKDDPRPTPAHTNITETMRKLDSAPSTHNAPEGKKHRQIPVDLIEEESMESFPASDPPSRSHGNRPEPRRPGQSDD